MNDQAEWQMFVSYRATQSMFVRQVVDQLLSSQSRIWFAEYMTFDWQRRRDLGWVEAKISAGIARSDWGVIFSSKDYMDSIDCCSELNQLLEKPGAQRILQISLDGTRIEALGECRTIQCASEDVMEAVDFIAKHVGVVMATPARPGRLYRGLSNRIRFGNGQFTLDAYGWRRWWRGALDAFINRYSGNTTARWGPFLQRDVRLKQGSNAKILMNLRYGLEQPADYDKWSINFRKIKNAGQEREAFNTLNEYAAKVHAPNLQGHAARVTFHGVHLLLTNDAFGHIASTYTVSAEQSSMLMRKVSIHLSDPGRPSSYYEFVFTFLFYGSMSEYFRNTGVMDDLALSVAAL